MPFELRRVVTGHNEEGKAIVTADERMEAEPRLPGYDATAVWCTSRFPPSNDDDGTPGPKGARVLFRIGEFQPGVSLPVMHRTETQDVAVVLSGVLEMALDSGEVAERLTAGDFVVQRGTMHAWIARGDEPVRVLFVMMDALPVHVGGKLLPEDLSAFGSK